MAGLNETPTANRVHIGFFGRRNAGKSSVVNAVTGQNLAIVSETKGTTTDPVYKAMELLPLGPVVIIDTPGFDDEGALGELRIQKTKEVLQKTDVAVLVVDAVEGLCACDEELIRLFEARNILYLVVYNKSDLLAEAPATKANAICVSALEKTGIDALKEKIAQMAMRQEPERQLVGDLVRENDFVVLVVPIDKAAPKGRLILPQQQTIRDLLDVGAVSIVVKETELKQTLASLGKEPALLITDSQVFARVHADTPVNIPLTSFSILMARYKGFLNTAVAGVAAIEKLQDGDSILISEACTHHRQCEDIGSVKLPRWLQDYTGKQLRIELTAGRTYPEDLSPYALVIHCGACMINEREMQYRMQRAVEQSVPFTNYGLAIAYMQGILKRSLEIFPDALALLGE